MWLQRAVATTVKYECGFKFNTDDQISSAAFERGAIMGVLKQVLTADLFETNGVAGVDYIMRTKELDAMVQVEGLPICSLAKQHDRSSDRGVKEFCYAYGDPGRAGYVAGSSSGT